MIIEQKNANCSSLTLGFSKMLGGPDFFPFIRAYKFTFNGDASFTMQHLQEIVPHPSIAGSIEPTTINNLQTMLMPIMATEVDADGNITQTPNEDLVMSRVIFFWDCIQSEFYQPMKYFFIHKPAPDSYFTQTTHWSFCFVALNDTKGIVVTGKTWHNAADCTPESDDEALFRKARDMF